MSLEEETYICALCESHVLVDEINNMDNWDYMYWGTNLVCDKCIENESSPKDRRVE